MTQKGPDPSGSVQPLALRPPLCDQRGSMSATTVHALAEAGQSIWLDYIRRDMTRSGELASRVESEGLRGVTSNP